MYLAVKAVCDTKPAVWQRSEKFEDAFTDFCVCVDNLVRLQPAIGIFQSVVQGVAVELEVAETILTTEMDELVELFESVDEAFVNDYTAARSMELPDEMFPEPLGLPAAEIYLSARKTSAA